MRTIKIDGEQMELPERLPDHPYFRSQAWSRRRGRAIYGMYVSEENMTFRQVGEFFGVSQQVARQIVIRVARVIRHIENGHPYFASMVVDRD